MTRMDRVYGFVFRGLLVKEAAAVVLKTLPSENEEDADIAGLLAIDALDERFVTEAQRMSIVYVLIAAFENSVRELISSTLKEEIGEQWWETSVSEKIRSASKSRMEEEEKVRWHTPRGTDPINFTMLPNLLNIIRQNQERFPIIPNIEWAANIFDAIERSRNVIMHSGRISRRDMARLGTFIRDWAAQVYS
jgi:Swt1-like HEPN